MISMIGISDLEMTKMKILLDTHMLLWAISGSAKLPSKARKMIVDPDNEIYISIISPWEVELKHIKHPDRMPIGSDKLLEYCSKAGYSRLSIRPDHIRLLSSLPPKIHADPFDRMLICQAEAEDMILLTCDSKMAGYKNKHIKYM